MASFYSARNLRPIWTYRSTPVFITDGNPGAAVVWVPNTTIADSGPEASSNVGVVNHNVLGECVYWTGGPVAGMLNFRVQCTPQATQRNVTFSFYLYNASSTAVDSTYTSGIAAAGEFEFYAIENDGDVKSFPFPFVWRPSDSTKPVFLLKVAANMVYYSGGSAGVVSIPTSTALFMMPVS